MAKPKGNRRKKPTRATVRGRSSRRPAGAKRSVLRPTKSRRAASGRAGSSRSASKRSQRPRTAKRPAKTAAPARAAKKTTAAKARPQAARTPAPQMARGKSPRLDRDRRILEDTVPTPPSSLNMDRHGSAARTGRAEIEETRQNLAGMSSDIAGGDMDVDVED